MPEYMWKGIAFLAIVAIWIVVYKASRRNHG